MKRGKIFIAAIITLGILTIHLAVAQHSLPSVMITELDGNKKNFREVLDSTKTSVVVFWAVWSHTSQENVTSLLELSGEWKKNYNAEIIAVSIDDARNTFNVKPLANKLSWNCRVFLDINSDLKRALNIAQIPSTVIISKGQVISTKTGYFNGDEDYIEKILKKSPE